MGDAAYQSLRRLTHGNLLLNWWTCVVEWLDLAWPCAGNFRRSHREPHLVNIDRIRKIRPWDSGDCRIVLQDGTA